MGQGTESCGGYDVDDDPYEDGLADGVWTMRDSQKIKVADMSLKHLKGARSVAMRAASAANFSSDADKWRSWVEIFDDAIEAKKSRIIAARPEAPRQKVRGATAVMRCHCGAEYEARTADIKRGWGLSCSKRCASIRRDYGRPAAKPAQQQGKAE